MLTTLLVLGNFLISGIGTALGIQVAGRDKLKEKPLEKQTAEVRSDITSVAKAQMLEPFQTKMLDLKIRQSDLLDDLTFLNDLYSVEEDKGLEEISPELLQEKKNLLQKQLLDLILESERLSREYASNGRVRVKV